MSRKKKEKKAERRFYQYYDYWLTRMLYVSSSAIEWEGLPESCDPIFLENCLNRAGAAIMVRDEILDTYLVGQNASVGQIDIYGYPTDRRVIFLNGNTAKYDLDTSVIIYNNSMRSSDLWIFQHIAKRLADMDSAIDVNMQSQKTMPIIPVSPEQQLTIENLYSDIENNIPYTLVDANAVDVDMLRNALTFDNRKSFTSDLMIQVQRETWNRFLTYVGVNNVNIEKRERTNVPEINSNLDEIMVMRRNRLNSRQRAADLMREKWGIEVTPRYYSERSVDGGDIYSFDANNMRTAVPGQPQQLRPEDSGGSAN